MKKIAIASGKGGTGKTTVSVNLFYFLSRTLEGSTVLVDCDVEEPNSQLFLKNCEFKESNVAKVKVPVINKSACVYCKECSEFCSYNAITILAGKQYAEVDYNLCHSCGACLYACNSNAISEREEAIGTIYTYNWQNSLFIEGRLKIGSSMQTTLIKKLKKALPKDADFLLFDAPPGTSCNVVETIHDTDFVILVTEPTPFGLHDLSLMVELVRNLKLNFGVVVNKSGIGNNDMYSYLQKENIALLGEIPFSKTFAKQYSAGNILEEIPSEFFIQYRKILEKLAVLHV